MLLREVGNLRPVEKKRKSRETGSSNGNGRAWSSPITSGDTLAHSQLQKHFTFLPCVRPSCIATCLTSPLVARFLAREGQCKCRSVHREGDAAHGCAPQDIKHKVADVLGIAGEWENMDEEKKPTRSVATAVHV